MVEASDKEKQLNRLLNKGKYWGDSGAVMYFRDTFLPEAMSELKEGNISLAVKYIEVLDRAIISRIKTNFFQKINTLYLLYVIQGLVKKIKDSAESAYSGYKSEQLLVLLCATVHCVQILEKRKLLNLFFLASVKTRLAKDIERLSEAIAKKDENTRRSSDSLVSLIYRPEQRIALEAEGVLFEFTGKASKGFRERALLYCQKNELVLERDTLRTVCSLYRHLGEYEKALQVARQFGSPDQVMRTEIAKKMATVSK